jgi:zinc protease
MARRTWNFFAIFILAITLGAAAMLAQSGSSAPGQKPPVKKPVAASSPAAKTSALSGVSLKYEKYTLPNGLEVILSEDHRLPMVAVSIWYHVGPANELPGRTGFAHLFEHMMFEGSKHVPGSTHFRLLEAAGASLINGTTDFDRTNYFETLPSNQLELALWLESDRMGYLPDKLDEASLANQHDVVRNERRQSVENSPYGIVEEAMFHQLFPQQHPYYADVIGSHADIQAAKLEDVRNFFKQYYTPNNASLAIVGDYDPAKVKQLVEKYFGPLKRGPAVPRIAAVTPAITSERRQVVQDQVQLPRVYEAWITSKAYAPGDADGALTASVLGGGKSSRLYKKLVYEKQIALDVQAQQQSLLLGSIFEITVTARPGHTADEIEKAINEEVDSLRKDGPTSVELNRARNGIETRIVEGLEFLGGFGGVADRLNQYNHYLHNPGYLSQDLARYDNATTQSVKTFADQQLKPTSRVVVYGVPGKPDFGAEVPTPPNQEKGKSTGGESINADAAWREKTPAAGPARPLNLPVPQKFTLSNGLTVLYTHRPGLPVISAELALKCGNDSNPVDKAGLAAFTANMLQQGTAKRNATQIADEAALLGASLTTGSNTDSSNVSASSLTNNFSGALDLLADIVLHPTFPQEEVERRRASRLAALLNEDSDPNRIAFRLVTRLIFGTTDPYGYESIGTEASLKSISRDEMMAFWKQNYTPANAALVVAGSMTLDQLKPLIESKFGGWSAGAAPQRTAMTPDPSHARVVIVDRPGAAQTEMFLAQPGPARSTPDYAALEVMDTDLGGLFSSRINMNLREEHGYTYGAFAQFIYFRSPGFFVAGGAIRTDATAAAVTETFKEIRRMMDTRMTPEELNLARDSGARSLPGFFESASETTGAFTNIFIYDLAPDFYQKLPGRFSAVTAEEAQAMAMKYLKPDQMIVVCVGDRAKIEADLKKLNLGAMEIRDTTGKVIE